MQVYILLYRLIDIPKSVQNLRYLKELELEKVGSELIVLPVAKFSNLKSIRIIKCQIKLDAENISDNAGKKLVKHYMIIVEVIWL